MPRRLPSYYFSHISSNKLATTHFKRISFYFLDCNIYLGIMLNHNYDWIQNHFTLLQNRIAADKSFHGFSSPIFMNRYNYCGISKKLIPRAQCVPLLASCISKLRRFLMGLISVLWVIFGFSNPTSVRKSNFILFPLKGFLACPIYCTLHFVVARSS